MQDLRHPLNISRKLAQDCVVKVQNKTRTWPKIYGEEGLICGRNVKSLEPMFMSDGVSAVVFTGSVSAEDGIEKLIYVNHKDL